MKVKIIKPTYLDVMKGIGYGTILEVVSEDNGFLNCQYFNKITSFLPYQVELIKEETNMIYKDEDIKVGTKIICKDNDGRRWWKKDKVYEVVESKIYDNICIIDEEGDEQYLRGIILRLNDRARVKFELVKEKYTENDLKAGNKLLCTKSELEHWTLGKMYEIKLNKLGVLEIKDDDGDEAYSSYILESLNKEWDLVEFELIKEENNMQDFKVGDLVEVVRNISHAYKNTVDTYEPGDIAIVTEVNVHNVRIGDDRYGNLISKHEIKKVEPTPELTEYEKELVLRLADTINRKDNYLKELEDLRYKTLELEEYYEIAKKDIKEISKKLLTK